MNYEVEISKLKSRLGFLEGILDDSHDGIIACDTEGRIVEFNRGAENIFGYKKEEVAGKLADSLYFNPPERQKILKTLEEKGVVGDYDIKGRTKPGNLVYLSSTMSYLRDNQDHIIGTIGIVKNIGERRKTGQQRIKERVKAITILGVVLTILVISTYLTVKLFFKGNQTVIKPDNSGISLQLSNTQKQLSQTIKDVQGLTLERDNIKQQLIQVQQENSRIKNDKSGDVVAFKEKLIQAEIKLQAKEKELAEINNQKIYLSPAMIGKNIIILKKELPFTRMLTTYYWGGKLKEIKQNVIVLQDENDQVIEIPASEVWGYKID